MTHLDPLSRTALVPFWARVRDAQAPRPILGDQAALTLAGEVERRFGRSEVAESTRVGCCLRNRVMDEWIGELAAGSGGRVGTVIDVGVGLDTRLLRRTALAGRYVEIDNAAIISLREQLLPDTGAIRVSGDGMSVVDWIDAVDAQQPAPTVLVLEGVLTYQEPSRVSRFFAEATRLLPGAFVLFDSLSPLAAWPANRPAMLAQGRPRYSWSVWRTGRIRAGSRRLRVLAEKGFLDLPRELILGFSLGNRALHAVPPMRRAYRLTLAQLPA